ncbi:MAG: hypothetical protein QM681_03775 [Novosphingobium sp.]
MAFAKRRWDEADRLYRVALQEANRLFEIARAGGVMRCDAAPMLVVATTNAAENWIILGRCEDAGKVIVGLARQLVEVVDDGGSPPDFRQQCLVHLKGAVRSLTSVLPRAGWSSDAVLAEVMQVRNVALSAMDRPPTSRR